MRSRVTIRVGARDSCRLELETVYQIMSLWASDLFAMSCSVAARWKQRRSAGIHDSTREREGRGFTKGVCEGCAALDIPASHTAIDLSSELVTMRLLSEEKWTERTAPLCAFCFSAASSSENHLALHDSSRGSHDPAQARQGG